MPATSVPNRVFALNQGVVGWVDVWSVRDEKARISPHTFLIIPPFNIIYNTRLY